MTINNAMQITKIVEEFDGKPRLQARLLWHDAFWGVFNREAWVSQGEWEEIGRTMGWNLPVKQVEVLESSSCSCKKNDTMNIGDMVNLVSSFLPKGDNKK